MIDLPLSLPLIEGLGWTIVHSLWQATLLAGVLWVLSRTIDSVRWRYRLAYGTLLAQLVVSIATFFRLYEPAVATVASEGLSITVLVSDTVSAGWSSARVLPVVVLVWLFTLAVGLVRLGWSFGRVRRMRWRAKEAVDVDFTRTVRLLAERIGYHGQLRIALSKYVDGPALVGHLKPVLLFPVTMVNQLTAEEAEAVILHELAHLQRKDHWWNLLQCLIEVLFQYHPMVWWIGARIREEREHCCDDVVLTYGPGGLPYAKALLYFETQRTTPATAVALTNNSGGLLGRVQRFLHQQNLPYQMKSRLFLLPLLALIALVGTAAYAPSSADNDIPEATAAVELPCPVPSTDIAPATAPEIENLTSRRVPAAVDTLPRGRHQVSSYRNGKSTEFLVEDGKIKSLKIDGKEIPESEFNEHEPMIERMLSPNRDATFPPGQNRFFFRSEDLDLDMPELHSIDIERYFENAGEDLEFHFESLGENFEKLGLRFEDMGERLGERFEGMFEFKSGDGNSIFFHTDSLPAGGGAFYFADSLEVDDDRVILRGNARIINRDQDGIRSNRIRIDRREIEDEDDKIREMEAMIERLEREKAQMQRDLERQKRELDRDLSVQQREMRDAQRQMQLQQRREQQELREIARDRRDEERDARELLRSERERNSIDYEVVVDQLRREGLIPDEPVTKFMLDNDRLKINGKKASSEAHSRMLEIIDQRYGNKLGQKFKVEYNNKN